jgi:hypothetical protein
VSRRQGSIPIYIHVLLLSLLLSNETHFVLVFAVLSSQAHAAYKQRHKKEEKVLPSALNENNAFFGSNLKWSGRVL